MNSVAEELHASSTRSEQEGQEHSANLIAALTRIADEHHAANHQNASYDKGKRRRDIATIVGLFLAAIVAAGAIWVTHKDAAEQVTALSGQIEVLQGQLAVMEANQRPWVKIERIAASVHPTEPGIGGLMFSGPDSPGVLPLDLVLKNVGPSPAFNVRIAMKHFFGRAHHDDIDLAGEHQKMCEAYNDDARPQTPMVLDNTGFSRVIFPNDTETYSVGLALLPQEISKFSTGDAGNKTFQLWFHGCVSYTFAHGHEPHLTSFAYRVSQIVDTDLGKGLSSRFKPWESIPVDRIYIEDRPMTTGVTN